MLGNFTTGENSMSNATFYSGLVIMCCFLVAFGLALLGMALQFILKQSTKGKENNGNSKRNTSSN